MYVAAVNGTHVVKRMPHTGCQHAQSCEHFEPPAELSGLGQVTGSAIREDPDAELTTLTLAFPLTKGPSRATSPAGATEHESVRTDGTKLTLRATLHYLWDAACLTRWSPRMADRRSWGVVHRELMAAAAKMVTKGLPLSDLLYVPEPFSLDNEGDIVARRRKRLSRLATSPAARMILVGEVKDLEPCRFGHRLVLKHAPGLAFQVPDDLHKRLVSNFHGQLAMWGQLEKSHLMVIGTFAQTSQGLLELETASLVNVNEGWIPFDSLTDREFLDAIAIRRFTKSQRYNLPTSKPMATAVLFDTEVPTALYVIPAEADAAYVEAVDELAKASQTSPWWWFTKDGPMPALPPVAHDRQPAQ